MRYGKIYYYDRLGNKVADETTPEVKEEVLSFPGNLERSANRIRMTRGRSNFAQLSPPFAANSGFVPNDPFFKEDIFGVDSPPVTRMPDELKDDFNFGTSGRVLETPPEPEMKSILPGDILSPLNDLRASPEARDDERYKVIKELEKLDVDDSGVARYDEARTRDFNDDDSDRIGGRNAGGVSFSLKHSRSTPEIDEIVQRREIEEECELCEHCLLEMRRLEASQSETRLKEQLQKHIYEVNEEKARGSRRRRELLPMGVLPPFMNRDDDTIRTRQNQQKVAYRIELEEEMARKKLANELEKAREQQMHNFANTEDAKDYARIRDERWRFEESQKERNRDILEKQMELKKLTRKESGDRLEWWEKKPMPGQKAVERDARFLSDQLKRNEALKRSVEQLEKFKEVKLEDDLARRAANKLHYNDLREKIGEQSALIRDRDYGGLTRNFITAPNPTVFKAWEDAHLQNDRRYRVLQDLEHQNRHQRQVEEESKCIRCRRCHRVIRRELKRRVLDEVHRH